MVGRCSLWNLNIQLCILVLKHQLQVVCCVPLWMQTNWVESTEGEEENTLMMKNGWCCSHVSLLLINEKLYVLITQVADVFALYYFIFIQIS